LRTADLNFNTRYCLTSEIIVQGIKDLLNPIQYCMYLSHNYSV